MKINTTGYLKVTPITTKDNLPEHCRPYEHLGRQYFLPNPSEIPEFVQPGLRMAVLEVECNPSSILLSSMVEEGQALEAEVEAISAVMVDDGSLHFRRNH